MLPNTGRLTVMFLCGRSSGAPPITTDAQGDRSTETEPQTG
jgi:hypothetical protein